MENKEGNIMTREEAASTLNQVLTTLALNSVHNKRLLEYADELDRYIAYLDAQEAKKEEKEEPKAGEETDEPKAE
jgi:septal ring factor EnvC (AmiA/AmiB activator)